MFPTLSEAINGHRLTVATDFYTKWMAPVGLILLFLTGVGPLLAWRKSTLANIRHQFLWPVSAAVVTAGTLAPIGRPVRASGPCLPPGALRSGTEAEDVAR